MLLKNLTKIQQDQMFDSDSSIRRLLNDIITSQLTASGVAMKIDEDHLEV